MAENHVANEVKIESGGRLSPFQYAKVMAENIGSQRVLEKCGFSFLEEGTITKNNREIEAKIYVRRAAT